MSQLIIQPGQWNSFTAAEVESFLAQIAILLGLTEKRKNFLNQIHKDVHGHYTPDKYYKQCCEIYGRWFPSMVLKEIMKDCDADHKKQLKIWYQELISMEPMDEDNPIIMPMILPLSKVIDTF